MTTPHDMRRARAEATAPLAPGMLALSTAAFAACFCAWSTLGVLAPLYQDAWRLSPVAVSVLVTAPVLVGSLGRIPVGLLTDRYGARILFPAVCAATVLPLTLLAWADSYPMLVAGGIALGAAGTSFAAGVPFVSAWFPARRRGLALGVYALGNAGTALAGVAAPRLWAVGGPRLAYLGVAGLVAAAGILTLALCRSPHDRAPPSRPGLGAVLRLRDTRQLAVLYSVTFGGFVSLSAYGATFLHTAHGVPAAGAAAHTVTLMLIATTSRPLGGWLADRWGGKLVYRAAIVAVTAALGASVFAPSRWMMAIGVVLAGALGAGNGAVFALLATRLPTDLVGSAGGVIGAAGGLGGLLPPLVLGVSYQASGSYTPGLCLLLILTVLLAARARHPLAFPDRR